MRTVTRCLRPPLKRGRNLETGTSKSSLPSSTSFIAALIVDTILVIEAKSQMVESGVGTGERG